MTAVTSTLDLSMTVPYQTPLRCLLPLISPVLMAADYVGLENHRPPRMPE